MNRAKERGLTDRTDLYSVLDAGMVCHLGVIIDDGPVVIPTGYGRIEDTLYLHGSSGARSLRTGGQVCVTVTHLDGVVLARSVFNHSMNYRSAMIYGEARRVEDPAERLAGLRAITDQLAPGQWEATRQPNARELAATLVLAVPLAEASVKVRTGAPLDEEEDYALAVWAGVLPRTEIWGPLQPDPRLEDGIPVPEHLRARQ